MSTDDINPTTLTDFGLTSGDLEDVPDQEVETDAWGRPARKRRCQNCDAHVPPDYERVCGGNDGRVRSCPRCHLSRGNGYVAGRDDE